MKIRNTTELIAKLEAARDAVDVEMMAALILAGLRMTAKSIVESDREIIQMLNRWMARPYLRIDEALREDTRVLRYQLESEILDLTAEEEEEGDDGR